MLGWLCVTFGVAFSSALVPLVSVELFVLGLAAQEPQVHWLALGAVVAVAQVLGKLLFYFAARGWIRLPAFLHRHHDRERPLTARRVRWEVRTKRLRDWVAQIRERCERHPGWMYGTYSVSSVFGLPPFMAMVVLAGLVRMRLTAFIGVGLLGRFIRFSALAASPALFAGWFL